MESDPNSRKFRHLADDYGLLLRSADSEEPRFVFALAAGPLVAPRHPTHARELLRLAESLFGAGRGEAFELGRLVAKREELEGEAEASALVWQPPDKVYAELNPEKWVRFDVWVADQHLMEDALMLDGPLDKEETR